MRGKGFMILFLSCSDLNSGLSMEIELNEESVGKDDVTIVSCEVLPGEDSEVSHTHQIIV